MKTKFASLAATICAGAVVVAFQNCSKGGFAVTTETSMGIQSGSGLPDGETPTGPAPIVNLPEGPSLLITTSATSVLEGKPVSLMIYYRDVESVTYKCTDAKTNMTVMTGLILKSGDSVQLVVDRDILCVSSGRSTADQALISSPAIEVKVDCGIKLKNADTNQCENYKCNSVEVLPYADFLDIPARTAEGVCYAVKVFDRIPQSSSVTTSPKDFDVLARDHDNYGIIVPPKNPYILKFVQPEIRIGGPRVLKLSGSPNVDQSLLVDNMILIGVYPSNQNVSGSLPSFYKVWGTYDSGIQDAMGKNTGAISFKGISLPLIPFPNSGRITAGPVVISSELKPQLIHRLDIRALDGGFIRELSEGYLVFQ